MIPYEKILSKPKSLLPVSDRTLNPATLDCSKDSKMRICLFNFPANTPCPPLHPKKLSSFEETSAHSILTSIKIILPLPISSNVGTVPARASERFHHREFLGKMRFLLCLKLAASISPSRMSYEWMLPRRRILEALERKSGDRRITVKTGQRVPNESGRANRCDTR